MLQTLPADMPVKFEPITGAYSGANHALRFDDLAFYTPEGDSALPLDDRAVLTIYVSEDRSDRDPLVMGKYLSKYDAEGGD